MHDSTSVFTICVPTYNRGRRALALANDVLPGLETGCVLMIIDNWSHRESEFYEKIAALAKESGGKLVYRRNDHNMGFHGNYLNCLKHADSPYMMVLSDEDRPNLAIIPTAISMFRERQSLGIVRGGISPMSPGTEGGNQVAFENLIRPAGEPALSAFALFNSYFSGTIYNRGLLERLGLITRLEKNLRLHHDYPHLYFEGLACAVSDITLRAEASCFEGDPQLITSGPEDFVPPYSFGARVDQFIALRDCLLDAVGLLGTPFDARLFANLYLWHCAKFFHLIGRANAEMYERNNISVGIAANAFAYFACAAMSDVEGLVPYHEDMMKAIRKIASQLQK